MEWGNTQKAALKAGILVYAMNQSQTGAIAEEGPWGHAHSGYCMGLAVRWIALRYQGQDFPYDPGTKVFEETDWQATRVQNVYEDASQADEPSHWAQAAGLFGLKLSTGLQLLRPGSPSGGVIAEMLGRGHGCYGISLNRDGGGHAIAAQNEDGETFRLFDANFGHFAIKGAGTFEKFLDQFFGNSRYRSVYARDMFIGAIEPAR